MWSLGKAILFLIVALILAVIGLRLVGLLLAWTLKLAFLAVLVLLAVYVVSRLLRRI